MNPACNYRAYSNWFLATYPFFSSSKPAHNLTQPRDIFHASAQPVKQVGLVGHLRSSGFMIRVSKFESDCNVVEVLCQLELMDC